MSLVLKATSIIGPAEGYCSPNPDDKDEEFRDLSRFIWNQQLTGAIYIQNIPYKCFITDTDTIEHYREWLPFGIETHTKFVPTPTDPIVLLNPDDFTWDSHQLIEKGNPITREWWEYVNTEFQIILRIYNN